LTIAGDQPSRYALRLGTRERWTRTGNDFLSNVHPSRTPKGSNSKARGETHTQERGDIQIPDFLISRLVLPEFQIPDFLSSRLFLSGSVFAPLRRDTPGRAEGYRLAHAPEPVAEPAGNHGPARG